MKATLKTLKDLGADGFVFGILQHPGNLNQNVSQCVDVERNKVLVQLADRRPCTFHRAFDCIPESCWDTTLADLIHCGFSSILTSGGPSGNKATDCMNALATLSCHSLASSYLKPTSSHQVIDIIVGGGVRSTNIQALWEQTCAQIFHSSALPCGQNIVSVDEVTQLKDILQKCASTHEKQYQCA